MNQQDPKTTTSTALAVASPAGLAMVLAPGEAQQRLRELQDFIAANMVEGIDGDYAIIPGTKKRTLLKPGAEKLAEIYGFAVDYTDARPPIERWGDDGGSMMFAYFKRAVVTRRNDGLFLGAGLGSCNSHEEKYGARWVFERDVPEHIDRSRLRQKSGIGRSNKPYTQYQVPNERLGDCVNTLEKMACKRALVMAVIAVTRSSGLFTQDMEDAAQPEGKRSGEKRGASEAEYEEAPSFDAKDPNRRADAYEASLAAATTLAAVDVVRVRVTNETEPPLKVDATEWVARRYAELTAAGVTS